MSREHRIGKQTLFIVAMMVSLGLGCAKVPEEEANAAQAALDKAYEADAATYAPEALRHAEDANAQLDAEIEAQGERFALTRSYREATELAVVAREAAEAAESEAMTARDAARTEAKVRIDEARTALEEARTNLGLAPVGKGTRLDLMALQVDLSAVETDIAEAERAYQEGHFLEARNAAEAAKTSALKVLEDIGAARSAKRPG
jgi:hypothetical protein